MHQVYGDGHDLVDDLGPDAVAEVAEVVLARDGVVQTSQEPVATSLVTLMQIVTELGVIDVLIDLGGHFEHDKTGRIVAQATAAAVGGGTQGTGEAEVQGGTDKPTEAAIDIALRRQRNGMWREYIVREPAARGFGAWCGEGVSVVLIEDMGMGDKSVEGKGRELLGRKR